MRVRLFKRHGMWHYECPCCADRPTPIPHRSYGVMLKAAEAHIGTYHWRRPRPRLGDPPTPAGMAVPEHALRDCDALSALLNRID